MARKAREREATVPCDECAATFFDKDGLAMHKWAMHKPREDKTK